MLRHHLYYTLKPYLPWRVRMSIRRLAAQRKLRVSRNVWPIDEAAAGAPPGWPGWPDGKQFAFVITHDVEGPAGLARCMRLAELEKSLGFRSSFNFIPEGPYRVAPALRQDLESRGFEIGVHDLVHDGKLYRSRQGFEKKAESINRYVTEWGASGFRSGFMLRNLRWLHALNVEYDASTFDTDPFEPQSTGASTIFPFWISNPNWRAGDKTQSPGYVELPYTLPQDSTLFLLLREKSAAIWLRKLDWIAGHGGMALINVHPDYIRFDDEPATASTVSVAHYKSLLEHVLKEYRDRYWQPLPRVLAAFAREHLQAAPQRSAKRIAMVTHSFYENDNRVTRYAAALAARGDHVDVFSLRRTRQSPASEVMRDVNVFRVQYRLKKSEQSKLSYLWPTVRFLIVSSWHLTWKHVRDPYDAIHIHNIPDFLVFAAWYPRLTGVPIILDIHDIVPEFFGSKFGAKQTGMVMRLLKWMERGSARFSHHIIMSNHLWLDAYTGRTGTAARSSVFINNVDTNVFRPQPRTRVDDRLIIIFPGGLQWHQGLDIALRAFRQVITKFPQAEFHVYGDGNMKPSLVALAAELGFGHEVKFFDPLPITEIVKVMANADLGVVPKRADSFGNQAYSTKIMEFMSLGIPVVVSRTQIDQFYFNDSVVRFFESGNHDALAQAIIEVLGNVELRRQMVANALRYSAEHSWDSRKTDYLNLVDSL